MVAVGKKVLRLLLLACLGCIAAAPLACVTVKPDNQPKTTEVQVIKVPDNQPKTEVNVNKAPDKPKTEVNVNN
jgi:hypothetical protein